MGARTTVDGTGNGENVKGGIAHSIRPGAPVPVAMLVVVMNDGSYLLMSYPQGEPAAFIVPEDAELLRQGLGLAFGVQHQRARP
ncbi:MAG: hypothetical protein ACRDTE_20105 [Pseudonocardiaceae bacterium]